MSKEWAGSALCSKKQQLIAASLPLHMGLCLALHLREALDCGTSYFILMVGGFPWQLGSQWEPCFLRKRQRKEGGGIENCGRRGLQGYPPCLLPCVQWRVADPWGVNHYLSAPEPPIIYNPGLTQGRPVLAICWDHHALAFRSGPLGRWLVANHINRLHQALQKDKLRKVSVLPRGFCNAAEEGPPSLSRLDLTVE